ncbi:hypothetical protein EVAR_52467_1 [Eumeta japonica]|uniref:Uncharacterized protein n=1 Tax=Eumeta variegata TaxID=151549 RepID=A0A4C1YZR3_EUMVA|nr:hypothetical protein EVAR_52467_1 [Eumeta japonica]
MAAAPTVTAVTLSVKQSCYYSIPWRTVEKLNSQDAPASHKIKASKATKSSQPTKAINSKVPTATIVAIDEADVITPLTPKKFQRPPPLFIHNKGRWSGVRKQWNPKALIS